MRWLLALTMLAGTMGIASRACAGEGEVCCPNCHHVCEFSWETEKYKKHCWITECKPICVPKITFPWQDCCGPKCAKIKYVHVLKKHEYECERCKCKFTPVCADGGCYGDPCGHGGRCGQCGGACAAGGECEACGSMATAPTPPRKMVEEPSPVQSSFAKAWRGLPLIPVSRK